jgi:hypothetical protein
MNTATREARLRFGIYAASSTLAGALLSGPVALALLAVTHPEPAWQGPDAFVRSYHPIQTLPYFLGFFLVGGFVSLIASLHAEAPPEMKPHTSAALAFAAAFSALVFMNYVIQTTFVPVLARSDMPAHRELLAALTMSNPKSLGWGLEMWGYAVLGLATWLVAPVFQGSRLERAARWSFVANGPMSLAGGAWTALDPGWELTSAGALAFGLWNLLVVVMAVLSLLVFRRRHRADERAPAGLAFAHEFSTRM